MIAFTSRGERQKSRITATEQLASLSSTPFPNKSTRRRTKSVSKGHNATSWSDDLDSIEDIAQDVYRFAQKSPLPIMPSPLFRNLAQSQFELLSHSLIHNGECNSIKSGTPKTSSMILYLPKENQITGQLEFVTAVTYPNPISERVFIASDSSDNGPQYPQIVAPTSALRLPGFRNAKDLIPSYPFISASDNNENIYMSGESDDMFKNLSQDSSIGVSVVEEISSDESKSPQPASLSVTLFSGLETLGVLMIWPFKNKNNEQNQWTWSRNDKLQVSRAANSLALALSMDNELTSTQVQSEQFRMHFADSLHQVKSPIQALRTFGKLLQRQLAEETSNGPLMHRVSNDASSEEYELSWSRRQRQALKLAEDMVKQGERVVDLIQPMDALINRQYLLPASTSSAIELYRQSSAVPITLPLLGDFDMQMAFPQDVIGPVVYTFQALARENGVELSAEGFDQDADIPGVTVCAKYLIEAVTNVFTNAISYVPCKKRGRGRPSKNSLPRIKVTLTPNEPPLEAGATLYVEDNGPGIGKEDTKRVFDRGYRGEQVKDLVPGTGIGLSMSKLIIQQMGGCLDVLEEGPHSLGGATIRIILFRSPSL